MGGCLLCLLCRSRSDPAAQIVCLFRAWGFCSSALPHFFFMCSKQSNYMRLYCLKKMKMLYQTLLCYNSLQLQFHVYRYKLNAHLHAHATKTESQRFRNLMEIPRKFDLLIRMFYSASSCNEKNFVYLLACSPNRAYLDS